MSDPKNCAYCQSPLEPADARVTCSACGAEAHEECWKENGGCSVYGCRETPQAEMRTSIEIPMAYWGRETKPCPACGQEILAAAVRCRHCGATFASQRPEDSAEFKRRAALESAQPQLRRRVVTQFVLAVVPFTTVLGLLMSLVWFLPNRSRVATLPPLYLALARLAVAISMLQTLGFTALFVGFELFQSPPPASP